MARITVIYHCGCGYSTPSLEAAIRHSDSLNHTLTAAGEIRSEKPKATADVSLGISVNSFDDMRAKLRRG